MYKDVYIGLAHGKAFDFDKEGNWNGYMPTLFFGKRMTKKAKNSRFGLLF